MRILEIVWCGPTHVAVNFEGGRNIWSLADLLKMAARLGLASAPKG